jgi:hypothetical protein
MAGTAAESPTSAANIHFFIACPQADTIGGKDVIEDYASSRRLHSGPQRPT